MTSGDARGVRGVRGVRSARGLGGGLLGVVVALLLAVLVAVVLQASVLDHVAVAGVAPDLVLMIVIATALALGTEPAMVVGFASGLLLDLAPPADGVAGRWALALLVVGYLSGRLHAGRAAAPGGRPALAPLAVLVAVCAFVGTSVYALTGVVLHDHAVAVPDLLRVVGVAVAYDVAVGVLVVPLLVRGLGRAAPDGVLVG